MADLTYNPMLVALNTRLAKIAEISHAKAAAEGSDEEATVLAVLARALDEPEASALLQILIDWNLMRLTDLYALSEEHWRELRLLAGLTIGQMSRVKLEVKLEIGRRQPAGGPSNPTVSCWSPTNGGGTVVMQGWLRKRAVSPRLWSGVRRRLVVMRSEVISWHRQLTADPSGTLPLDATVNAT